MNIVIGSPVDLIRRIISMRSGVFSLVFSEFEGYELFQDRIEFDENVRKCFEQALDLRARFHLPFWDSFNLSTFNKSFVNYDFLEQTKLHNRVARDFDVTSAELSSFIQKWDDRSYLTINSKLRLIDDSIMHMPLLDFHIPVSENNQKICGAVLRELKLRGYLLVSGKSYHFYGKELVTESELMRTLATALFFSPIIDKSWIAHQLIERSCCLRITPKYNHLPYLVEEIK